MSEKTQLEEIFFASLDKGTPEERLAFLDAACAGQPELRAQVERLLAAHAEVGDFLQSKQSGEQTLELQPAAAAKPAQVKVAIVADLQPGDLVAGRYKLLQLIGEGGMGSVWMADQTEPVKRRVAIKLIRGDRGTTKMILARFEAERQAIALMDHPNIARLLDAGATESGQPFFAMELVKGVPLTEYCDAHKLGIADRLRLFQLVCSAVQHAHQKGIVHRDLKPSNILVENHDQQAVPKVIDFGLAKATSGMQLVDHTLFTAFGAVMGTPIYMAPEQAAFNAIDIDTRADIYSLGVILYELMTGETPISRETCQKVAMDEVLKLVREQDAPKPSSRLNTSSSNAMAANRQTDPLKLSKLLRGDLDWIVLKALEKDRNRRYETANGLAADLRRYLTHEPIVARPPSVAYRIQKTWQRNRIACNTAAAIAASLIVGLAFSVSQTIRANSEAKRAVEKEQLASRTLGELRATAPAFVEQARSLAAAEQFELAIEKINYAIRLRPEEAAYLVRKADLYQCQLRLTEAAAAYRAALRIDPELRGAAESARLCDELLAEKTDAKGQLSRESLSKLHVAMQAQQRSAAELMPVAKRLGEERQHVVKLWLEKLQDLPISAEKPLESRLKVLEDGRLALDLSGTKVVDLAPLAEAPLATLNLKDCVEISDIGPLRGLELEMLNLSRTKVADLGPLSDMKSLKRLVLSDCKVTDLRELGRLSLRFLSVDDCRIQDLAPLSNMSLEAIDLSGTRVDNLTSLAGQPIREILLSSTPVLDYSPLASLPLERCAIQHGRISDLGVFRGKPLRELTLWGCVNARNYAALVELDKLEVLLLPAEYRSLPSEDLNAIGKLRKLPNLRQLGAKIMDKMSITGTSVKDEFWREWDLEYGFLQPLRERGIRFQLGQMSSGKYELNLVGQPIRDLDGLKAAPFSRVELVECPVTDLSALKGNVTLESLSLSCQELIDLGPLGETHIQDLYLSCGNVKDFTPLRRMRLRSLAIMDCARGADLSVLAEIDTLEELVIPTHGRGIESLKSLPRLKHLSFQESTKRSPQTNPDEFWKEFEMFRRIEESGLTPTSIKRLSDGTWDVDVGNSNWPHLEMFRGVPVSALRIDHSMVSDLSPLQGAPIRILQMVNTPVFDLSPLMGAPLQDLRAAHSKIRDLGPLRGLPLVDIQLNDCAELQDISPLVDCPKLEHITLPYWAQNCETLQALPNLKRIGYEWRSGPVTDAAQFWKLHDKFAWIRQLKNAGQLKSSKLTTDGTWEINLAKSSIEDLSVLKGAPVSHLLLFETAVSDLEPLRGMPLKYLNISRTKVADLQPLAGIALEHLWMSATPVSDVTPLRGMPLVTLALQGCPNAIDVSPLTECTQLKDLGLPREATNIPSLRKCTQLERIGFDGDKTIGWRPNRTSSQFWREFDAKKK